MQNQLTSAMEVTLNTASGFIISWVVTYGLLNSLGHTVSNGQSFQITLIFTLISLVRSYFWRRLFNRASCRQAKA